VHAQQANDAHETRETQRSTSDDASSGLDVELNQELSIGVFAMPGLRTTFMSDQLEVEAGLTDAWSLHVNGGITHFFATSQLEASNMLSFGVGADWSPTSQLTLGANLHGAPTLTFTESSLDPTDPGTFESSTGALGGDLSAEYAGARLGAFALQLGVTLGMTRYAMRERFIEPAPSDQADWEMRTKLWQGHGTVACSVSVRGSTEVALAGSYFAYFGAPSADVTPVLVGGVPFEPMRYAVRSSIAERVGPLRIALHGQYAGYEAALGHSWNAGLEAQWSPTDTLALSAEVELTRAAYTDHSRYSLYQASLAGTLAL
jgi:hypothetical protein